MHLKSRGVILEGMWFDLPLFRMKEIGKRNASDICFIWDVWIDGLCHYGRLVINYFIKRVR